MCNSHPRLVQPRDVFRALTLNKSWTLKVPQKYIIWVRMCIMSGGADYKLEGSVSCSLPWFDETLHYLAPLITGRKAQTTQCVNWPVIVSLWSSGEAQSPRVKYTTCVGRHTVIPLDPPKSRRHGQHSIRPGPACMSVTRIHSTTMCCKMRALRVWHA